MRELRDAKDFFEQVATPAYLQFNDGNPDFLKVFAMASSLFHVSEWVFHHNEPQVQAKYGPNVTSRGKLWSVVEDTVTDAGFIRDVTNSNKHAILTGRSSTGMRSAEDTGITIPTFDSGIFDSGIFDTSSTVLLNDGTRQVPLEPIAADVFQFWEALVGEFHPS